MKKNGYSCFGDELYKVTIIFHLGKLINDAIRQHLLNLDSMCKMRGRKRDYVENSLKTFKNFVKENEKYIGLSLSEDKDLYVEDKDMNLVFTCGINKNVKNVNHHILCVAMDDIREEMKNYDCPMVYFTYIDKEDNEHECCHDFIDILTYHEYFETPLKYIKIENIEKIG